MKQSIALNKTILFLIAMISINSCSFNKEGTNASPEHQYEVNLWHTKRIDGLKKDTGWLNLVGLYWLEEGENTIGSSDKNKIVFPQNAPPEIGILTLQGSTVIFNSANGSNVKLNG